MSYTPGPWRVHDGWATCIVAGEPDNRRDGSFKYIIAICSRHDSRRPPESDDNARLIAAAPEMLEFIQEFANSTRVHFEAMRADPNEFVPYLKAMSLIRKASGDE